MGIAYTRDHTVYQNFRMLDQTDFFKTNLFTSVGWLEQISADMTAANEIIIRLAAPFNFFWPMDGYAVDFFCSVDP